MTDIVHAKKELYNELKSQSGVLGAGIKGNGQSEYIVIFVKALTKKLTSIIPSSFKGIQVKAEMQGVAKSV